MKKLALIFVSCFLLAWYSPFVATDDSSTESLTCTSYMTQTDIPNSTTIGQYSTQNYKGFILDDSDTGSICEYTIQVYQAQSGIDAERDYYAEVWLLDGARDFNPAGSPVARSDKVDGDDTWSAEDVTFTFSTPGSYDCTGSNEYGVMVKSVADGAAAATAAGYDGTYYISVRYDGSANGVSGCVGYATWDSDGASNTVTTSDAPYFELSTMQ